ncbi:MAG: hypothetical protein LQ352_008365 [Teloschistes flavicans]|nr:MAG: hypothetical protein LQ352_008365 [Teloschistes flavicans]
MDVNILPDKAPERSKTLPFPSSFGKGENPPAYASSDEEITHPPFDHISERHLLLKTDLHVLPVLFLLFLISFVDRSNLANARIEGLEKSLHIPPKSNGYNVALFSFTIPYVLFEVPANILLKKVKPQWWLSGLMFGWGK